MYRSVLCSILVLSGYCEAVETDWDVNLRTRASSLKDGDVDGKAASMRIRSGWETKWSSQWQTLLQLDGVQSFWQSEHSDAVRFNGQPAIPDAEGFDVNQAYALYSSDLFKVKLGRQAINYDDERFIGSVSFWQNEQTFDAAQISLPFLSQSKFEYTYLDQVLRIFGRNADESLDQDDVNFNALNGQRPLARLGEHDLDSHLLHLLIDEWDFHTLKLYYYDYRNISAPAISSQTSGIGHSFNYRLGSFQYKTELAFANQVRTELPDKPETNYTLVEGAAAYESIQLALRFEQLSSTQNGNGMVSFITPLATLHEHQGWADHFLTTPNEGISDYSLRLLWRSAPWRLDVRYHGFESDQGQNFFGHELDIDLSRKINKHQKIHLRTASFNPGSQFVDRFKERQRIFLTYSLEILPD